jgi:TatD DNase family protein
MTTSPYIDFHTHKSENENNVISIKNVFPSENNIIDKNNFRLFSTGLHPSFISSEFEKELAIIKNLLKDKSFVAVGEIGLDRLTKTDFKLQEEVFITQLEIAQEINKPIIIHCVRAYPELIHILKQIKMKVPVIFHGFNSNLQIAKELIKNGYYFSLGYDLLKPDSNSAKTIKNIPREMIFLETDDKDASIHEIYMKASELLDIQLDILLSQVHNNFKSVIK